MLLRYKPCWVTYGEERKEGRKEARANPYICKKNKKKAEAKKKKVGFVGMNGALIIYPRMLEIAKWRF